MRTCVLCVALMLGAYASAAAVQTLEVGIIDFYGLRKVAEEDLRGALARLNKRGSKNSWNSIFWWPTLPNLIKGNGVFG